MTLVYISLGSNVGDKVGYVQQAVSLLKDIDAINLRKTSSFYETEPLGVEGQDWYINAAILVDTSLSPEDLLEECNRIEKQLGRKREEELMRWGPRTIDVDILLYGDRIISTDVLQVPHPRLHERSCALVPLMEIDSSIVHPILNKTIKEIYEDIQDPEKCFLWSAKE